MLLIVYRPGMVWRDSIAIIPKEKIGEKEKENLSEEKYWT